MPGKNTVNSSVAWIVVALTCAVGVVAWLMSVNGLQASVGVSAPLTFVSPVNDPRLSLSKRVDNNAPAPGSQINYTLSYSNTRLGAQAYNVRLYDFLPAGVQFISSDPPVTPDANGVLLFTAPLLGPGTEDHSVTVLARVLEGYPQLNNYALVVADAVTPTWASVVTAVSQPLPGRLRLTKTAAPAALVNSQLVYVLRCDNLGTTTLAGVSLIDVLPGGSSLSSASPAPDSVTPPLLRWSLGDLAPGASRSVTVTTTTPPVPGVITNTAIANASQSAMTTTLVATQVVNEGVILSVVKDGSPAQVNVGDKLVYTLRYSNVGNQTATGVILTDTLPAGITNVQASPPPNSSTSQLARWQFLSLGAGAQGQVVITVTVEGPWNRTLHNVVDITAQAGSVSGHAERDTVVRPFGLYLPLVLRQ